MNLHSLSWDQLGILDAPRPASGAQRLILALTVLGLAASLVTGLTFQTAMIAQIAPDQAYSGEIVKPPLYYAAHAAEIFLLMAAGALALLRTPVRGISRGYCARLALFFTATLLMTARGYDLPSLLSTKIFDQSGPVVCFISMLVFVGARRENWRVLGKVMWALAAALSVVVILRMGGLHAMTRVEAVANLGEATNHLLFPAAWLALNHYPRRSLASRLHLAPILVYALCSFLNQTRLNFVMLFTLLAVSAYFNHKRRIPQLSVWIAGLVLLAIAGMLTSAFLADTPVVQKLGFVASSFAGRLDEDTRTGQVTAFVQNVQPHELLLGRGARATWNWPSKSLNYTGGTDIGYLTLLFYGGVPLLLTYIATHVAQGFHAFRVKASDWRLPALGVALLWAVRMFSSSYPVVSLEYYPVLLCIGACISREIRPAGSYREVC